MLTGIAVLHVNRQRVRNTQPLREWQKGSVEIDVKLSVEIDVKAIENKNK